MIQIRILSGRQAGATWAARRFPVRIGRSAAAEMRLEEDGVWDQHLRLDFIPATGIVLTTRPETSVAVNGESVQQAVLRNGDTIDVGSVKLLFWLTESRQTSLGIREALTWVAVAAVLVSQVALLYWLVR